MEPTTRTRTILAFTDVKSNAELIRDVVVPLGYLRSEWRTVDPTYGLGLFWKLWRPEWLVASDLDPEKSPTHEPYDATALPWDDGAFRAGVIDGPYKLCLDDETEVLTRRGWLRCDEVEVGDDAYSLDHETGEGVWAKVKAVHVYPSEQTELRVCEGKNLNFVATPHHRWPVVDGGGRREWRTSDSLLKADRVIHAARWRDTPSEPTYSDSFVELVAWFWTEGTTRATQRRDESTTTYGHICQSVVVNPENCRRIEQCFRAVYGEPVDRFERVGRRPAGRAWRIHRDGRNLRFIFSAEIGRDLLDVAPERRVGIEFLEALTRDQLDLFIETSLDGDGTRSAVGVVRLTQADPGAAEAFALACLMAGRSVSIHKRDDNNGTCVTLRGPHSKPARPGVRSEVRETVVWCPEIEGTSTWCARRRGAIYFTGNSGRADIPTGSRYGIVDFQPAQARIDLVNAMIVEQARVLGDHAVLLVKCQAQINSARFWDQPRTFTETAEAFGFEKVDELLFPSYRAQPRRSTCVECGQKLMQRKNGEWAPVVRTSEQRPCVSSAGHTPGPDEQAHAHRNYSTLVVLGRGRWRE